jgi:hypothetical protein
MIAIEITTSFVYINININRRIKNFKGFSLFVSIEEKWFSVRFSWGQVQADSVGNWISVLIYLFSILFNHLSSIVVTITGVIVSKFG